MGSDTGGLGGTAPGASAGQPEGGDDRLILLPGRSPVLDAAQLGVLRGYGGERDVAAGDVLFADGDETYDLIVLLAGTADIIEGYGQPGASVVASYGPSEFLGEIGMLTGQRAFLSAVATSAGRVLAVPVAQLRRVMAQESGLSDLILRTFLLRHSLLMSRGTGLTLIGSRFDPDTRRLLEVLARNRLVWTWLDLEVSPEAEQILKGLDVPVADLPIIVVPGGPVLRNPGGRALLDALAISGEAGSYPPGVRSARRGRRPGWARGLGLRRVRGHGDDAGRRHRARWSGGHLVTDRELSGVSGGPVRGGTRGPGGAAGGEVRRPDQAGRQSCLTIVPGRRAPGHLR